MEESHPCVFSDTKEKYGLRGEGVAFRRSALSAIWARYATGVESNTIEADQICDSPELKVSSSDILWDFFSETGLHEACAAETWTEWYLRSHSSAREWSHRCSIAAARASAYKGEIATLKSHSIQSTYPNEKNSHHTHVFTLTFQRKGKFAFFRCQEEVSTSSGFVSTWAQERSKGQNCFHHFSAPRPPRLHTHTVMPGVLVIPIYNFQL